MNSTQHRLFRGKVRFVFVCTRAFVGSDFLCAEICMLPFIVSVQNVTPCHRRRVDAARVENCAAIAMRAARVRLRTSADGCEFGSLVILTAERDNIVAQSSRIMKRSYNSTIQHT